MSASSKVSRKPREFWHGNVLNYRAAPAECWLDCSAPGQAADESVTFWRQRLNFTVPQEGARKCLQGYGAWDDLAGADDDIIIERVLWLAACDYREAKARRESPPVRTGVTNPHRRQAGQPCRS